jgi:YHS domain-containing protein
MDVAPSKTKHHFTHKNEEYHFCSEKCLGKFKASPEQYLGEKKG